MKFVCRTCESFMTYAEQERIGDGSLGVTFRCETCGHRFSMVTNAGETQMLNALGVALGGRTAPEQPLEMTRTTLLAESSPAGQGASPGGCPFPAMMAQSERQDSQEAAAPAWSTDAELRLERIPAFVRPMVQKEIERLARERGVTLITEEFVQEARERFGSRT
ncbi:MAG: PCP reductase family protein [Nitrospirae bacterium]|nr:PCP reductase family protein [Nitrospirota bacterium]